MMGTLISAKALHGKLANERTRIFDCLFSLADPEAGYGQYRAGHIPGAQYMHLDNDMSAPVIPGKTGRHPLPDAADFAARVRHLGVNNEDAVVAYDEASGAFAARLWWMLRWVGHADVVVLDGGFKAWQAAGFETTAEVMPPVPGNFSTGESLTRVTTAKQLPDDTSLLLDARDEARYRGEVEPIDPVAGHIPGAKCAAMSGNLTDTAAMKPAAELRERFSALGAGSMNLVCYCGSGVTAAHNVLALVHAGFDEPSLYPGSWSEWITDPERPIERGE